MCPIPSSSTNDFDLVVVPVVSLNPKKAKKKLKKAARAEDSICADSRLPVDKFDTDSIEVVAPVSLNTKKVSPKKVKSVAEATRPPVEQKCAPTPQADRTPTLKLEGLKKSWYDITMDDDDDFCGALSNK
eukprot:gnl/MRDRNA2_/MRDRNA2_60702_c0_seq1.p1 gnl/MRDRNA2_/MRDRNA2_60702_c0~~gnl/MRDRNA2_/MRDRNA2_60702_c0_seq1.p1  ORF type:complete len:130 (+),score=38.48 gnl/MRDRNA2_/MRDRNA2_60702_c0_seq1:117-506(+)